MPHDWLNSYVCMMAGHSDLSKFTEGSWQGLFTVNNERAVFLLLKNKNALREFLQAQNLLVNLLTGFPASCNCCRCTSIKTNQEIMIFTAKKKKGKKLHTCSYSGPGI